MPPLSVIASAPDATPGDNVCATAGAVCTLRAAMQEANAHSGADDIRFTVAGTFTPLTSLPLLSERVTIDATTAPGYGGSPVIIIDGAGAVPDGIVFSAGSNASLLSGNSDDHR
jgi:hypothetical protein